MKVSSRFSLFAGSLIFASLLVLGAICFVMVRDIMRQQIIEEQVAIARQTMQDISRTLFRARQDIMLIGENNAIEDVMENGPSFTSPERIGLLREELDELLFLSGPWDNLAIVDAKRRLKVSSGSAAIGERIIRHPETARALDASLAGNVYDSDVTVSSATGRLTVVFSAPVKSEKDGRTIGAVIGLFSWPALSEIFKSAPARYDYHILDNAGRIIESHGKLIHSEKEHEKEVNILHRDREREKGSNPDLFLIRQSSSHLITYALQQGFLEYKGRGWVLEVNIPLGEAFRPISRFFTTLVIALGLIVVMAAVSSYLFGRFLAGPIKSLANTAAAIGKGDLTQRAEVMSRDEIGNLAAAFNRMLDDLAIITISRQELENILQTLLNSVIVAAPDGTVRMVNQATLDLLKYDEAEIIGKHIGMIFEEEEEEEEEVILKNGGVEEIIRKKTVRGIEKTYLARDGRKIPVLFSASVLYDHPGNISGIVCVAQDVSDLKRSEIKFRSVVENAAEIIIVAQDGKIRYFNPAAERLFADPGGPVYDRSFLEWVFPEDQERLAERYIKRLQGEPLSGHFDFRVIDKSGRIRWVTSHTVLIEWEGRPAALSFISDVTDRIEAEEALKQTLEELRKTQTQMVQAAKLSSIGELTAGVAHELNQPLTVIRGTAQVLKRSIARETFVEEDLEEQLETILRNTKRMMTIINHLRTFSRRPKQTFVPVDLNLVIRDAMLMISEQLRNRDIQVVLDLSTDLPMIKGESGQLEQVVLNLLTNARDAVLTRSDELPEQAMLSAEFGSGKEGGRIEIITRSVINGASQVEMLVGDNGCGISPEDMDRIFEPFFTTKGVGKGTGLGLSIAYGIVRDHGGEIEVAKTGPRGTLMRVRLPAM